MTNSETPKQDVATIAPFTVPAQHKADLDRIAKAHHRNITGHLRYLIEQAIAQDAELRREEATA